MNLFHVLIDQLMFVIDGKMCSFNLKLNLRMNLSIFLLLNLIYIIKAQDSTVDLNVRIYIFF